MGQSSNIAVPKLPHEGADRQNVDAVIRFSCFRFTTVGFEVPVSTSFPVLSPDDTRVAPLVDGVYHVFVFLRSTQTISRW